MKRKNQATLNDLNSKNKETAMFWRDGPALPVPSAIVWRHGTMPEPEPQALPHEKLALEFLCTLQRAGATPYSAVGTTELIKAITRAYLECNVPPVLMTKAIYEAATKYLKVSSDWMMELAVRLDHLKDYRVDTNGSTGNSEVQF